MKQFKTHLYSILVVLLLILLIIFKPDVGMKALDLSASNFMDMFSVLPPIMLLIGLLDVWIPKEVMIKYLGEKSGLKGIGIVFLLGALAAGPLYAAFPVAAILLKKNARIANVLFFLGVWSTAKLPLVMFEYTSFGGKFTVIHIVSNLTVFLIGAYALEKSLSPAKKEEIYRISSSMVN